MRPWETFIFGFFSYLLFLSCSASAEGEGGAQDGDQKMWPDYDKAYVAVFNRTEDQFAPLVDDGKRLAIVEPKDLKLLNPQQLKILHTLVTGKHAATEAIDFYRPTAGIWFEKEGKITGFLEFSFESFSRRGEIKDLSKVIDWPGLAKWFERLGLKTNFDSTLYQRMQRKK